MSVHLHGVESRPLAPSGGPSSLTKEPGLSENADFDQAVDFLLEEIGYRRNPYFAALREKRFTREDFVTYFTNQILFVRRKNTEFVIRHRRCFFQKGKRIYDLFWHACLGSDLEIVS